MSKRYGRQQKRVALNEILALKSKIDELNHRLYEVSRMKHAELSRSKISVNRRYDELIGFNIILPSFNMASTYPDSENHRQKLYKANSEQIKKMFTELLDESLVKVFNEVELIIKKDQHV